MCKMYRSAADSGGDHLITPSPYYHQHHQPRWWEFDNDSGGVIVPAVLVKVAGVRFFFDQTSSEFACADRQRRLSSFRQQQLVNLQQVCALKVCACRLAYNGHFVVFHFSITTADAGLED